MPQHRLGPRLYLRKRKGLPDLYIIRDGARQASTGCGAERFEDAVQKLSEYLEAHVRPDTKQRDLSRILCGEVLMLYGQEIAPTKPSAATIGYNLKALLPFWGEKTLADVKGSTCRAYLKFRLNGSATSSRSGVLPSSVRRELKTLGAAINHWHRESPLAAVPKVTLPPPAEPRARVLERSEVARMLWAARKLKLNHVARFILIGVYTGTRHAAILKLRWSRALSGGQVDIEGGIIYRRGSAERETSKRRPPVRIGPRLLVHIRQWHRHTFGGAGGDEAGADTSGLQCDFVVNYQGTSILKMKRAWASVVKEAGLGKDVTPHTLRHTAVSWLLWQGWTIWDVGGFVGADASTIERVYGHHRRIEPEKQKGAA